MDSTELAKGDRIARESQAARKKGLGRLAVEAGLITAQQLELALREQDKTGRLLSDVLQQLCGLSAETVHELMVEDSGIERVDLARITVDPQAIQKISKDFALRHTLLPISLSQDRLTVVMANPFELSTLDQLQFTTRLYVDARYAPAPDILEAIQKFYADTDGAFLQQEKRAAEEGGEDYADSAGAEGGVGGQVIRLVDGMICRAIREEATDIHIEPAENAVRVRFRIDGILHLRPNILKNIQSAVMTRIKIMASMDISESRLPQDGRTGFSYEGKNFDLRVSTFPTIYGEKLVLRILDKERVILGLEQLGLSPSPLGIFSKCVKRPSGIILVTGPTGSGKTTTLYSTLAFVASSEKNIMTLEDPVEYEISGIHQTQINLKAGLTFASGLRAMLRQDPDIILVGEMRDVETVEVAIRAALTGHLVLSTLHTNDAVGAIPRLLDMEVNPSLMASSLIAIVAQRLVRKICFHCKEEAIPEESQLQLLKDKMKGGETFYQGGGCPRCFNTGYRGRMGIFEILPVSRKIARLIAQRGSSQAILEQAKEEGMTTMLEDGMEKASQGSTTLSEVIRVAYTL